MKARQKIIKQRREQRVFSAILGLFLLILTCLLVFSNWKIGQKRKELLFGVEKLRSMMNAMQVEGEKLREHVLESETEAYWEEKLREHGYKKPGESVVIIKKEDGPDQIILEPELQENKGSGFWQVFMAQIRSFF